MQLSYIIKAKGSRYQRPCLPNPLLSWLHILYIISGHSAQVSHIHMRVTADLMDRAILQRALFLYEGITETGRFDLLRNSQENMSHLP